MKLRVKEKGTNHVYELSYVSYDDKFDRAIYTFEYYGLHNWIHWDIPVYHNESLAQVLEKCNLVLDNS